MITPEARRTHMHVIGSTGEGKSKFLEHMIRQDIIRGNGVCLIDPHGNLYDDVVSWCASKGMLSRGKLNKKILLLNPSLEEWTFGFNPLTVGSSSISFFVDAMVKAVSKVWGGEDSNKTPRLKRCLTLIFHALAEQGLSLLEALPLIDSENREKRQYLTRAVKDIVIKQGWERINDLKSKPFMEEFESTTNRMLEFLKSPHIRNIVGQTEKTIDFRKVMDDGGIVLVNLSTGDSQISSDNARLLGTLIVNDLFLKAMGREKKLAEQRPFYLYIDECSDYVNEDIGKILDQMRKFGLHLVLANQHLSQLKLAGEKVYKSIMINAKTKVVFGGLDDEDSRILSADIFKGQFDLQEPKSIMNKPVVVGHRREWFKSHATGQSVSHGKGYGRTEAETEGESEGESFGGGQGSSNMNAYSFATTQANIGTGTTQSYSVSGSNTISENVFSGGSKSQSRGRSSSYSESNFESETQSNVEGESEGLVPIYEERPGALHSLEEQLYRATVLMVNQPQRHAIIKLPKEEAKFIETPLIKGGKVPKSVKEKFINISFTLNECIKPVALVEAELEERALEIEKQAKLLAEPQEPKTWGHTYTKGPWAKTKEDIIEVETKVIDDDKIQGGVNPDIWK